MMLPYIYEDPLAWKNPFGLDIQSPIVDHLHEILGAFLFYSAIHLASPALSSRLFGNAYKDMNRKTKLNFDIHVVSTVQCIISVALLIPAWNNPGFQNRKEDPFGSLLGYTPYAGFVSALTIGYFMWDLIVCLAYLHMFGIGFLIHAFAALYVFVVAVARPFCLMWMPAFLLFELSTPFVNINWFASRLPAGAVSDRIILINGLLLLFTFFTVRILWGFYAIGLVAIDIYRIGDAIHIFFPITVLLLNFSLDCLNVFWFSKMIAIAKKKLGGSNTRPVAKEAAKYE